jgi:transcriptional regulator with XRE-family HTH domain
MATRPTPFRIRQTTKELGLNISTWRKLMNLSSDQLAQRVGVSRATISRLENGDGGVSVNVLLGALDALTVMDRVVLASDPYETDFGRARSEQLLPKRVR